MTTPSIADAAPLTATDRAHTALSHFCAPDGNPWQVALQPTAQQRVERPFSVLSWHRVVGPDVDARIVVKAGKTNRRPREDDEMHEARAARALAAVFAGYPGLGVIEPLRTYPELGVVITEAVQARSLGVLIEAEAGYWPSQRTRAFLERGCTLAGQWLRRLHTARPAATPWTIAELREDLMLRVRLLQAFPRLYGMPPQLASDIERWLDRCLAAATAADLGCSLTHRDYSPSNMLYDGRALWVLDFTTVREAPRLLDVTRFLHQIDLLAVKPRYRAATRQRLQTAFLTGYADPGLTTSPMVPVFMARHALAHWLGTARRLRKRRALASGLLTVRLHRNTLEGCLTPD